MFTTNTVQAGSVPTLQYQEHPTQKSQGKNMEIVQQKNVQQTQQSQQQQVVYHETILSSSPELGTKFCGLTGIPYILLHNKCQHDWKDWDHSHKWNGWSKYHTTDYKWWQDLLHSAAILLQLCAGQSNADCTKWIAKHHIQYKFQMWCVRPHVWAPYPPKCS